MKKYAFGVDIGGTTVKMGLFETMGTLLDTWEIPTRKQENERYILPDIADGKEEKNVAGADPCFCGLGCGDCLCRQRYHYPSCR